MERPILFSGEMVKAILSGRKTQTRRVLKAEWLSSAYSFVHLKDSLGFRGSEEFTWAGFAADYSLSPCYIKCPYGKVGDRLWVRESWLRIGASADVWYKADDVFLEGPTPWRPSIHMPRWASRITLEITGIQVEEIRAISDEDARREGVTAWHDTSNGTVYKPEFQILWDSINNKRGYGWGMNPWVWVIEFEQVKETA